MAANRPVSVIASVISGVCVLIGCAILLAGCVAPPAPQTQTSAASASPTADAIRRRLTNTENGLEVRRWLIANDDRIATTLVRYVDGSAVENTVATQLKRNGFRFVRVRSDQLESLLADLGGTTYDGNEWHGQVPQWRSLLDRPIHAQGEAVVIDGMVRRYDRGDFRLMMRSWTVQMESGPVVHLELLPRRRLPQSNNLRRLLGEESNEELGFGSMAVDIHLQDGYAYILVGEPPQSQWPGIDADASAEDATSIQSWRSSRNFSPDGPGPDAPPPLTLGEMMLAGQRTSSTRPVLIFVPKIAASLFLTEKLAAQDHRTLQPQPEGGL